MFYRIDAKLFVYDDDGDLLDQYNFVSESIEADEAASELTAFYDEASERIWDQPCEKIYEVY